MNKAIIRRLLKGGGYPTIGAFAAYVAGVYENELIVRVEEGELTRVGAQAELKRIRRLAAEVWNER